MIAVKVVNGGKNHRFGGREKKRERERGRWGAGRRRSRKAPLTDLWRLCAGLKREGWEGEEEGTRVSNFKQSPATRSSGIAECGLVRLSVQ